MTRLRHACDYALAFLNERTPQSMTRLCAVLFATAGTLLGLAVVGLTIVVTILLWRGALTAEVITALGELLKGVATVAGALIAAGAVALLTRKRSPNCDTPDTPEES